MSLTTGDGGVPRGQRKPLFLNNWPPRGARGAPLARARRSFRQSGSIPADLIAPTDRGHRRQGRPHRGARVAGARRVVEAAPVRSVAALNKGVLNSEGASRARNYRALRPPPQRQRSLSNTWTPPRCPHGRPRRPRPDLRSTAGLPESSSSQWSEQPESDRDRPDRPEQQKGSLFLVSIPPGARGKKRASSTCLDFLGGPKADGARESAHRSDIWRARAAACEEQPGRKTAGGATHTQPSSHGGPSREKGRTRGSLRAPGLRRRGHCRRPSSPVSFFGGSPSKICRQQPGQTRSGHDPKQCAEKVPLR